MKAHTSEFKEKIKEFGRELDSKITYGTTELGKEELNSVTPHYESTILKSVMKQLDVDSNVEIPLETIINYQFGVKVGNGYEYLDYGNYVVYKVEKQEDTRSWKITCYDKMLYAMKPYESLGVSFPISIKDYLQAICTKLGLTLASGNFANEDKMIMNELYLDASGNGLDYTFRDVLDEIAQATGSTICINENDELEVRYPQNVGEYETIEGTDLLLENVDDGKDIDYDLNGDTTQDGTPTPESPIEVQTVTGRQEISVRGKNLFNSNLKQGGRLFSNGNYFNASNYVHNENPIAIKEGETYTLSANNYRARSEAGFVFFNNGTYVSSLKQQSQTFTAPNGVNQVYCDFYTGSNVSPSDFTDIQLEQGAQATDYEEYKGQSYEINLGKNLFDKDNVVVLNANLSNSKINSSANERVAIIKCEPNTTYTFSKVIPSSYIRNTIATTSAYPTLNMTVDNAVYSATSPKTYTTGANAQYIVWLFWSASDTTYTEQQNLDSMQVEKGSQATSYAPYKTPIELCKIGNYKDRIYKDGGKWYLHKEIGKYVFTGNENWESFSYGTRSWRLRNVLSFNPIDSEILIISNIFEGIKKDDRNQEVSNSIYVDNSAQFVLRNTDFSTISTIRDATKGNYVYYVLATPTTTEITDTELINQLNSIKLLEGMNNISVTSGDLSTPLKLTYLSEMDTIDEEYLKDVNVNFGEKFGPVNSVVLSRATESDSIYQKDDESVEQNGLTEIKIKDNQILNGNNRDEFLPSIFEKLNGLEYYLTDFSSTGVAYYDLLDKYKIKVFDNSYKTIMLNNEVDITQGLEEQIYADRLEESETDYTKSDKTDRKINQAYIIVDKQNQQINSVVQNINTLQSVVNNQGEQVDALGTRLTQTVDNITASVTSIETKLDNGVSLVKTTSVIIDDNGLNVSTDNSKISTTMTNNSFEIKDSGDNMLAFFGYDETENISKSQMDNLTVTNYFVSGYHRTEKFERNGERRTGHFYIG